MYIFVDESGTFTYTEKPNSWSVIAALAVPERHLSKLEDIIEHLRLEVRGGNEVKLKHLSEARYIKFLRDLSRIGGLAFAIAADTSLMPPELIAFHRDQQAKALLEHVDKVKNASARAGIHTLSENVAALSLQLYTQLQFQIELFHKVVCRSSLYFSQHEPATLEFFRWRIDQKDLQKSEYERVFELVLAPAIQTKSIAEPFLALNGADYSYFERFDFAPGREPTYLKDDYGLDVTGGFDAVKVLSEDFRLVDSNSSPGVQAADLLASGIRRLLRHGFARSHEIALLLGSNLVSGLAEENPIDLLSLGKTEKVGSTTTKLLRAMAAHRKPILALRLKG